MTPAQRERWQHIERLAITPSESVITFEDKLIQHIGWTRAHAGRAIAEYRRFLMLAAEAGHPVSPSPDVDEVWHLHLLYTRNYWDELCPDVLGFRLHHEPATGTGGDRAKLDDWYAKTLASYQSMFGEAPPTDLWPAKPLRVRFDRVDTRHAVVLSRGTWRLILFGMIALFVVGLLLLVLVAQSEVR